MGAIEGIAFLLIGGAIYFLPTIAANSRKKSNLTAIFLVNLFFGWTMIGWFVALLWAVSNQAVDAPQTVRVAAPSAPASALCASCGKYSPGGTKFCPHCGAAMA